jgi:hypothetical protein
MSEKAHFLQLVGGAKPGGVFGHVPQPSKDSNAPRIYLVILVVLYQYGSLLVNFCRESSISARSEDRGCFCVGVDAGDIGGRQRETARPMVSRLNL